MSDAVNEVYRDRRAEKVSEMLNLLLPSSKPKSIEERSREAVERIFRAVDDAREAPEKVR